MMQGSFEAFAFEDVTAEGAVELPPAVCPQGVPESYGPFPEELPPGVSPLDDYLAAPDSEGEQG